VDLHIDNKKKDVFTWQSVSMSKQHSVPATEQNKAYPIRRTTGATNTGSRNLRFHITHPEDCFKARHEPSNVPKRTEVDCWCKQPVAQIPPWLALVFQI